MHIRTNPVLNKVFKPVLKISEWMGLNHPKTFAKIRYFARFHKFLDLEHPKTLNEKMLYMSLCTDTTEWTRLADKYRVREYIHECGLDSTLVELYGAWERAEDCDFEKLPNQFVLKCNHGSGDIMIVKDKNAIDQTKIKALFQKELDTPYGAVESGHHYLRIKPMLIAEELLVNDEISKQYSSSLIDYKIWCFNGKPTYIFTCSNREKHGCEIMIYDLNWNAHPEWVKFSSTYRKPSRLLPKPINFDRLYNTAVKLSEPFPILRCDLYSIENKVYFGEMTFTSLGGLMDYFTPEFLLICGDIIDIRNYINKYNK